MGLTASQSFAFGGSLTKAFSTVQMGRIAQIEADAQADIQERNARVLERSAKARIEKAKFDSVRQALRGKKILGRQIARAATSGAILSEGAPLRAITEQAEELELENILIGHEALIDAMELRERAELTRIEAAGIRGRGKVARRTARARATAGLLTDFATFQQAALFDKGSGKDTKKVTSREGKATLAKF